MPTVPRYSSSPVQQQALPSVRVSGAPSIETFGGGAIAKQIKTGTSDLASTANKLALEEKAKADDAATSDAYAKTVSKMNELFWDPQNGAISKKGQNAFGIADQYGEEFSRFTDEIESGLNGTTQKGTYAAMRTKLQSDFSSRLQKHIFNESETFYDQTMKSVVDSARDDAIKNYSEPGIVRESLRIQQGKLTEYAARKGLPPEWVKVQLEDAASKTHSGVISRMLTNDQDRQAKAYFDSIRGEIAGGDIERVEKMLEEGTLRGESQRLAKSITDSNTELTSALAKVDQIKDAKLQDEVRNRVKSRFGDIARAKAQASDAAFEQAYTLIEQSKNLDDIPPALMASLQFKQKEALKAYVKKDTIATDWGEWNDLMVMASTDATRSEFLQTNMLDYRNKLADSEFKGLVKLQTDLRKKDSKALENMQSFSTKTQILSGALRQVGIDPNAKSKDKAEKLNEFRREADIRVAQKQDEMGRKLNPTEMQAVVDEMIKEGVVEKRWFWFDKKKYAYQLAPGEKFVDDGSSDESSGAVAIDGVPKAEQNKIRDTLSRRGLPINDASIIKMYNDFQAYKMNTAGGRR